jgi:hypothetical protein
MAEETTATTTNVSQDTQNASQDTQNNSATVNSTNAENDTQATPATSQENKTPSIEELIQRAVDRATNKLGNDNKKLRESLEKLKQENLTAEQRKVLEIQEKEADLADREAQLQVKINREFAMKAIKEAGLDDGSAKSLELIDFVVCDDEAATLSRVKLFGELVNKFVKDEVDKTFRTHGRNPNASSSATESKPNIAEQLGKVRADAAKKSQDTLNYYYGGN